MSVKIDWIYFPPFGYGFIPHIKLVSCIVNGAHSYSMRIILYKYDE